MCVVWFLFFVFTLTMKDEEPTFDYDLNMIYGTWMLDEGDTVTVIRTMILDETSITLRRDVRLVTARLLW